MHISLLEFEFVNVVTDLMHLAWLTTLTICINARLSVLHLLLEPSKYPLNDVQVCYRHDEDVHEVV